MKRLLPLGLALGLTLGQSAWEPGALAQRTGAAAEAAAAPTQAFLPFHSAALEFRYPPALGTPRVATVPACPLEYPTDKPDGVAPEHLAIVFEGQRPLPPDETLACNFPNFNHPQVRVFPVAAYRQIYPAADPVLADLKPLLAGGKLAPGAELPFLPFLDAFPAFTERVALIPFASGRGLAFLTQWMIEPDTIGTRLAYVFQGLSADGKTFVLGLFPVKLRTPLPGFDIPRDERPEQTYARYKPYAEGIARTVRDAKDADFAPGLDEILELLRSLRLN